MVGLHGALRLFWVFFFFHFFYVAYDVGDLSRHFNEGVDLLFFSCMVAVGISSFYLQVGQRVLHLLLHCHLLFVGYCLLLGYDADFLFAHSGLHLLLGQLHGLQFHFFPLGLAHSHHHSLLLDFARWQVVEEAIGIVDFEVLGSGFLRLGRHVIFREEVMLRKHIVKNQQLKVLCWLVLANPYSSVDVWLSLLL